MLVLIYKNNLDHLLSVLLLYRFLRLLKSILVYSETDAIGVI